MATRTSLRSVPVAARPRAFVSAVAGTLRRQSLCEPGMSVLVAVSGGPDSVALLRAVHAIAPKWRLSLSVAHCNYGLRGRESDEDEAFVRALCARLNLPCHVRRVSPATRASRPKVSLQEWAREIRYDAFNDLAARHRVDRVALGHTADDQAETVLLWMLRGAGITGLSGMPIIREERYIRPLLQTTRQEVLDYLAAVGQGYRTDSSNQRGPYLRNRIRRELMPALVGLNPAIIRTLSRQAELLSADERYLQAQATSAFNSLAHRMPGGACHLECARLLAIPLALQRRVIREAVREVCGTRKGPSFATVTLLLDRLLHGRSGSTMSLPGAIATRQDDRLVVQPGAAVKITRLRAAPPATGPAKSVTVTADVPVLLRWAPTGQSIQVHLEPVSDARRWSLRRNPQRAVFDADRVTPRIGLKGWQPGDWFCPAGMGGHRKKLQDFWVDAKVSRAERVRTPVMVSPEGILWVVGYRADERFLPGPTTTRLLIAETVPKPRIRQSKER